MASRHVLVCLPPTPADQHAVWTRLTRALNKVRGGHFDSYEITTGRYTEHFPLRDAGQADDPRLIRSVGGAPQRCAGGPLGLLDLEGLREHRATQAAAFYDAWRKATAEMPPARPLSDFQGDSSDWVGAFLAFREQPPLKAAAALPGGQRYRQRYEAHALITLERDQFIARARRRAVPGNSLLDLDGVWSTDPAWLNDDDPAETGSTAYHDHVNTYLDALPADHLVIGVDCRR